MPTAIQFLRSSTENLRPQPTDLSDGMPLVGLHETDPGLYFKLRNNDLCKIGPCSIGDSAPNSSPVLQTGNTVGEFWLDTSSAQSLLKVWDGTTWQNTSAAPTTDDLDSVTTDGNTTTNSITVGGLTASGITFPTVDGTLNQVMVTDGAGNLSFVDQEVLGDTLDDVTTAGNVTTNSITIGGLTSAGITYPAVDGTANQILVTDGSGTLSFATTATNTLNEVTTAGSITTNAIAVGGLTSAGLIYPTSDGTANQVLITDGSGTLSFATTATNTLNEVTTAGNTTTNTITIGGLTSAGLIYPTADGTANQVLITDGSGNLSFANPATPVTSTLDEVTTAGNTTTNGIVIGTLTSSNLAYPTSDGTANQVMITNGSGTLSFSDVPDMDNGSF